MQIKIVNPEFVSLENFKPAIDRSNNGMVFENTKNHKLVIFDEREQQAIQIDFK